MISSVANNVVLTILKATAIDGGRHNALANAYRFNQPVPLNNSNLYLSDGALCEAVIREGAGWDSDLLASIGQQLGTAESLELGRLANAFPPELLRYDPQGSGWMMCVFILPGIC